MGIWAYAAHNVLIQFCVSHHNQSPGLDGGGFDFDGGVTHSIMQYNYTHDNEGAGFGLFQYPGASPWTNNVIRYNVSQNDGIRNGRCGIAVWSASPGMSDCDIYNNTIYNDLEGGHAVVFMAGDWAGMRFRNNIFVSKGNQIEGDSKKGQFQGNIYWGIAGSGFSVDEYSDLTIWAAATGQEKLNDKIVGTLGGPETDKTWRRHAHGSGEVGGAHGIPPETGVSGDRRGARPESAV